MNRKLVALFVLITVIFTAFGFAQPAHADSAPVISIAIANANQGDTLNIPVTINTNGTGIRAYQFDLSFDATKIKVNSVTDGGFLKTTNAGSCLVPVQPTINNTTGTVTAMSCALMGGAGETATGTGTLATVNVTVLAAAANGKASWSISNYQLRDVSSNTVSGVTTSAKWIQVGPGPALTMALSFTPHGTGSTFDANVVVTNAGGSASDADTLTLSLSNTNPAASQTFTVPSLDVNASQTFTISNAALASGQSNSIATASLANFGTQSTRTYSAVSSNGSTNVNASFGALLSITPDTTINFASLALGANTVTGNLNVKSNDAYEVDVYDNGTTAWHLTEWNGTSYLTDKLADALSIASTTHTVTSGSSAELVTGTVAGQSGDAGQDFALTYSQNLHYADPMLTTAGETYHLVLTFNGYVTM